MLLLYLGNQSLGSFASAAEQRSWLLTLPIVSFGREQVIATDFNLGNEASVAVQGNFLAKGQDLYSRELEQDPTRSLISQGQELSFMFQRFSNPAELSGFHWGLGAGYRQVSAEWIKEPWLEKNSKAPETDLNGKVHHHLNLSGTTVSGRLGYRYVADSLGFAAGIYLKLRHFQNHIADQKLTEREHYETDIAYHDRISLKRRMMSTLLPGIEFGWAF